MSFFYCSTGSGFPVSKCFLTHDALVSSLWLCIAIIIYSLVWSIVGNNCSKVDQIWSITPWVFCWLYYGHYYYTHSGASHVRLLLVCCLTTVWGLRLTYNFARRGGYGNLVTHEEDYRWPILRKIIGNWFLFLLFNISFIASYQNLLLFLIALPAYGVMRAPNTGIQTSDIAIAVVFSLLLVMETVADQQHWMYQNKKYAIPEASRKRHPDPDVRDGFLQSGLFYYCRHPNYFAEQAMWVCVYLFSVSRVSKPEQLLNVYSSGAVLLVLLFQGSMSFSEGITAQKYKKYAEYQKRVSMCVPFVQFHARDAPKSSSRSAPEPAAPVERSRRSTTKKMA